MTNMTRSILNELNVETERKGLDLQNIDKNKLENLAESFNENNDKKKHASHSRSGGFRNSFGKCSY